MHENLCKELDLPISGTDVELAAHLLKDRVVNSKEYGPVLVRGRTLLKIIKTEIHIKEMTDEQIHMLIREVTLEDYGFDIDDNVQVEESMNKFMESVRGQSFFGRLINKMRRRNGKERT